MADLSITEVSSSFHPKAIGQAAKDPRYQEQAKTGKVVIQTPTNIIVLSFGSQAHLRARPK